MTKRKLKKHKPLSVLAWAIVEDEKIQDDGPGLCISSAKFRRKDLSLDETIVRVRITEVK